MGPAEAAQNTQTKKTPTHPLRMGPQRVGRGLLILLNAYCAMVFTDTPRSIGVDRP